MLNPHGHAKAAELPCTNMLGVCGMYVAGLLYWLLGAGSVYGVCLAVVPLVGMLMRPEKSRMGQWVALVVMLLTACACLSVQPWVLVHWAEKLAITTPGGKLGYLDGTCVAEALLGRSWALCLLILAHAVALIFFARFTPKELYRAGKDDIVQLQQRWSEKRRRAREEREKQEADWSWQSSEPEKQEPLPPSLPRRSQPRWDDTPISWDDIPAPAPHPQPESRQAPPQPLRTRVAAPPALREEEPLPRTPRSWTAPQDVEPEPPAPTPAPLPKPQRAARAVVSRSKPDNILDLMQQVEDEIERENYGDIDDESEAVPLPINRHTQDAINRHFGYPASSPAPRRQPQPAAPRSVRESAPAPALEPAPALSPVRKPVSLPVAEDSDYPMPPYDLLNYEPVSTKVREAAQAEMLETQAVIADALESFRINVQLGEITRGPSVTRYEFSVPRGQSVKAVANKRNDLMAATQSRSVNILAPIPGKSTVGVELENSVKEAVYLRELLQSEEFHNPKIRIPVALGKDVYGNPVIGDLAAMPHVLVAGSTGSGKSVCINSMLVSMLYKFRPDELKLVLVDPKVVEMQPYKKLPHLAVPVVTDPGRVIGALRWAVNEMEHRYKYFSKMGVRNLEDFNNRPPDAVPVDADETEVDENAYPDMRTSDAIVREIEDSQGAEIPEEDEQGELDFREDEPIPAKLPYIVIVIDELADLMMQVKEDLENYIGRLTQKARAAGIHLIVATQSPRAQVVTGIIKTNLPSRIALKVSSQLDSRVILDEGGAENLLGRGDLLFLPPGGPSKMTRAQGAFVSDAEIASIIQFCAAHAKQSFVQSATAALNEGAPTPSSSGRGGRGSSYESGSGNDPNEELYNRCVNLVVTERKASITLLQRRFRIGYGKAAEIMELMEKRGVVSPQNGTSRPREVLIEAPE